MKIDVISSQQKQFFLYIYHLSLWHFSAYQELADIYLAKTGPLSGEEKLALRVIKKIFRQHDFSGSYIGIAYMDYDDDEVYTVLEKMLGKKDFVAYTEAVQVLQNRLDKLWLKDKKRLAKISDKVTKLVTNKKYQVLIEKISTLFGPIPTNLRLVVLAFPEDFTQIGGSANTAPTTAVIEVTKLSDVEDAVSVAFHELLHSLVKQRQLSFLVSKPINKIYKENIPFFTEMSKSESVEELFLRFFLPDGYLTQIMNKSVTLDKYLKFVSVEFHERIQFLIKNDTSVSQADVDLLRRLVG